MTSLSRLLLATTAVFLGAGAARAADGAEVLDYACGACHAREEGGYDRIDAVRKTPEAWDMTVQRMGRNHGVALEPEERAAVVRYLADTRGLSVAETEDWRYILEREPVAQDLGPNARMSETCGRCHSYARVALQRRTPEDWRHLVNFHLGQFPTLEYQALARDRDWWGIAQNEIMPFLAETYPLGEAPPAADLDLSGEWPVAGRQPGRGDYAGLLTLTATESGYDAALRLDFADGASESFTGSGALYGAGEWRASLASPEREIRQVFALKEGGVLEGRWFELGRDVIGGRLTAARAGEGAAPRILGVSPGRLRAGETAEVLITGVGLTGELKVPEGLTAEILSASDREVKLKLSTPEALGAVALALGEAAAPEPFVVFGKLDRISISPETAISRVGGGGGPIPKTPAQFEAFGWLNGPDGEASTEDDVFVGRFPAQWRTENFDAAAEAMRDADYAGSIDQNGLFTPGVAGPNPERPMMANNIGNLKVVAEVEDAGRSLQAEAHLYATVQRFVDALIR